MSATEQMAAILNELMGPRRNAAPGENIELRFDDDEVCKFYLAGYCPNEMFVNTKADLGPCYKLHDDILRKAYRDSDKVERLGYEEEFLSFIKKMHNDMQKKIKRNKDRLAITQPGACMPDDENRIKLEDQVEVLTEKINECMAAAEALGSRAKIEEAQEVVRTADKLKIERDQLKRILMGAPGQGAEDNNSSKPMEVCEICGCFLIVGDAQQRIDEHFVGKQHVGFAKIKATIEEMERRLEEKELQRHSRRNDDAAQKREIDHESRHNRDKPSTSSRKRSRSRDRSRRSGSRSSHDNNRRADRHQHHHSRGGAADHDDRRSSSSSKRRSRSPRDHHHHHRSHHHSDRNGSERRNGGTR